MASSQTIGLRVGVSIKALGANTTEKSDQLVMYSALTLEQIITDLCSNNHIEDGLDLQLQFDSVRLKPPPVFITEENRHRVTNGDILILDYSGKSFLKKLLPALSACRVPIDDMAKFLKYVEDQTFAHIVFEEGGFTVLAEFLCRIKEGERLSSIGANALSAFLTLAESGPGDTWNNLDLNFFRAVVANFLYQKSENSPQEQMRYVLEAKLNAFIIIETALQKRTDFLISSIDLDVSSFIHNIRIEDPSQELQSKCISLINTVLKQSDHHISTQIRNRIYSSDVRQIFREKIFTRPIMPALDYQLLCLQQRLFNLLQVYALKPVDPLDIEAKRTIEDLWKLAFENDVATGPSGAPLRNHEVIDYSKLGARNANDPIKDFAEAPPGILALECIKYFADNYSSQYQPLVLENSSGRAESQGCPFIQGSCELVKLLVKILCIGQEPCINEGTAEAKCCPMFFTKEQPFYELYSQCIVRFTKTWKEMKATVTDMNKVLEVVTEQIVKAMAKTPHTFDTLKNQLQQLSFSTIQEERQREIDAKEERKAQTKPIKELREMIKPEITDIIKQQRINRMMDGFHFHTSGNTGSRRRHLYCKLSQNAKMLQYCQYKEKESIENLQSVNVLDIIDVVADPKQSERRITVRVKPQENMESDLNLECPDEENYNTWLDGLNAIIDRPMSSSLAVSDLDKLLNMEIKLRLLDAEGLNFPDDPPPIPPLPPKFEFVA